MFDNNRNRIIDGIKRGVDKCAHHTEFTKRIGARIEQELPGYTVVTYHEKAGNFLREKCEIKVWGGPEGSFGTPAYISHDKGVFLSWRREKGQSWYEGCLHELQIHDSRDVEEREEQEEALVPQIIASDTRIQDLLAALKIERENAVALFTTLPEPKRATVRKGNHCWQEPTYKMRARFPRVFAGKNE